MPRRREILAITTPHVVGDEDIGESGGSSRALAKKKS
jgi:hypothetical protein